ncbi:MAG: fatty acid desaturase [Hyphomicrobiaceae bacterium]|nr:MAG: fatty acid desaturase [Hyphomicrobiaceae bacterium]
MAPSPDVSLQCRPPAAVEWPTLALGAVIYGGWLALTYWHEQLPVWLLIPLGAYFIAWHSSFQHEVLHGHPTRSRAINWWLGYPPLALWLPFERYRVTHLCHHRDERLTDPFDDPETNYFEPASWRSMPAWRRGLARATSTLLGRLTLGPFVGIARWLASDARAIAGGDTAILGAWAGHLPGAALVLLWLSGICQMSLWLYLLGFVIPGSALMMIRSYAEHRAETAVERRTAVVEGMGPLSVLYLFNNLHAAHHERPTLAWYLLPAFYRSNRERLLSANGGLLYRGYQDVFRRFLLRPHDVLPHPLGRAPSAAASQRPAPEQV